MSTRIPVDSSKSVSDFFHLTGKVAIVTGGSRGIGRAAALGLAHAGADVVVVGRRIAACEAVAREIEGAGRRSLAMAADVADWSAVRTLATDVHRQFGAIHILVNNAGISDTTPLEHVTPESFDNTFHVMVRGPLQLAALVVQLNAGRHDLSIINVTSVAGIRPVASAACYCSAKAALHALTRVMALEWAKQRVRANALAPGPIMTDMMKDAIAQNPGLEKALTESSLVGRIGGPHDIVGGIVFLASQASSYMTGETLVLSGGT